MFGSSSEKVEGSMSWIAACLFVSFVWTSAAIASPRELTVSGLEALSSSAKSDSVRIVVNDGAGDELRIGDEVVYRFESDRPGYLTAIHVDTHGSATLLYPRAGQGSGRVEVGQVVSFPDKNDGFKLEVEPPIGRDVVYAFVTDAPVDRRDLGIRGNDLVVSFEPQQAPAFIEKLTEVFAARSAGSYRSSKVTQQVDGRGKVLYRSLDIANYFAQRTRSIAPAKLDLQIQFETNSADLDDAAKANIIEFAKALDDPRLESMRFAVSGHTDDRGTERHNEGLSMRRAKSVHKHLVDVGGIAPDRLALEAHGEMVPLMADDSEYARQMNRRVEFMPIRE